MSALFISDPRARPWPRAWAAALAVGLVLAAPSARAIQPLDAFVQSSRQANLDQREDQATLLQRQEEGVTATRGLLPIVTATGQYTFNQYEAKVSIPINGRTVTAVITPQNELDGYLTATVPLVNLSTWANVRAAGLTRRAAEAKLAATAADVAKQVARSYFDVLINRALQASAESVLSTDEANLTFILIKQEAGTAQDLDVERAKASVESSRQSVANAVYNVAIAERKLRTLSGLTPEGGGTAREDDLHEEPALETFTTTMTPKERSAALTEEAQRATEDQVRRKLLPSLAATAQERFTNATGFANESVIFQGVLALTWTLDASLLSQAASQRAATAVKAVETARASQTKDDDVYSAWMLVKTQIATCRAARANAVSTKLAYTIADTKYKAGTAQQIDLLQADRDAFSAQVTRIQTNGDLLYDRVALRLTAGLPAPLEALDR